MFMMYKLTPLGTKLSSQATEATTTGRVLVFLSKRPSASKDALYRIPGVNEKILSLLTRKGAITQE